MGDGRTQRGRPWFVGRPGGAMHASSTGVPLGIPPLEIAPPEIGDWLVWKFGHLAAPGRE
jgi:hypothetical protein